MRYGQDYLTDTPEKFASSLKARWQQQPTAVIVAEALSMLNNIYAYLSGYIVSQVAPTATIENAAAVIQQIQAVSSIADAMRGLDSAAEYTTADPVAYKRIVAIINRVDSWWTPSDGQLRQYINRAESGSIQNFSNQVSMQAILLGNLENAHVLPSLKQWAISAAYTTTHPRYADLQIVRDKYNADGSAKPGVTVIDIPMVARTDQIKQDYIDAVKTTQQGGTVDIMQLATKTGSPASGSKLTIIAIAATLGGLLLLK